LPVFRLAYALLLKSVSGRNTRHTAPALLLGQTPHLNIPPYGTGTVNVTSLPCHVRAMLNFEC